ncbi:MAG: glycosyltransferase, partial [Clostridiales bacterium]|nr:glycosyltransferase [Clostridiales bacterium]
MRIVQMLPTFAYGDAIGNNVIAIQDALKSAGISTAIYAENIDKRIPARTAEKIRRFKDSPDTVILYHLSTG